MENIIIKASKRTPRINFDFENHNLSISGESYPEDVNQFYGEIIKALEDYLTNTSNQTIQVIIDLLYFNSSSAKALIRVFDMLDEAAKSNSINIQWQHEAEDANMAELGQEFGEDLTRAIFQLVTKESEESELGN